MEEYQGETSTGQKITGRLAILDGIFYIVIPDEYAGDMYYAVDPSTVEETGNQVKE